MDNEIVHQGQIQSPFDSIKVVDIEGNEFWMARELMPLLGYQQWRRFEDAIERAKLSLQNSEGNSDKHFNYLSASASNGKRGVFGANYKLSRLGCYLVAMNGDPRKIEIAQAQIYFAIKTREAETVIPAQDIELEKLRLQVRIAEVNLQSRQIDHAMLTMHGAATVLALRGMSDQVVEVERKTIEVIDQKTGVKFKGQTFKQLAEYLSTKYGIKYRSGTAVEKALQDADCGNLIAQMKRPILQSYVPEEFLDEAVKALTSGNKQMLLGFNHES